VIRLIGEYEDRAIGRDTVSAMQSGTVFGYQALVAGLLARIRRELADQAGVRPTEVRAILTGGLSAAAWARDLEGIHAIDPDLTLKGLAILHAEVAGGERLELGLREYGPTPFPSYIGAGVVGVRSLLAGLGLPAFLPATLTLDPTADDLTEAGMTPEEAVAAVEETEPTDSDTPPDDGAVADEPPSPEETHSSRHDQLKTRIHALKADRPGLLPEPIATRAAEALAIRSGKQPRDR